MAAWTGRVRSANIEFPFEPYGVQLEFMDAALRAIEGSTEAVLESPTGTGKTLCLLAATLAWRKAQNTPTVIVYASRTHAQLSQAVQAFRTTAYAEEKTATIGSREQLCGHQTVSKLRGGAQNRACAGLCAQKRCHLRNNLDRRVKAQSKSKAESAEAACGPVMDIEELAAHSKLKSECAYFASRYSVAGAALIFAPYNYVLDQSQRGRTAIVPRTAPVKNRHTSRDHRKDRAWENAVVVLDEAHNVAAVAEEAASFELNTADIAGAVDELDRCVAALAATAMRLTSAAAANSSSVLDDLPTEEGILRLKRCALQLETALDAVPLDSHKEFSAKGGYLHSDLFKIAGIEASNAEWFQHELRAAADVLLGNSQSNTAAQKLELLERASRLAFRGALTVAGAAKTADASYRVRISQTPLEKSDRGKASEPPGRVLQYWCFSAGLAVAELRGLGARSVLFASGTLSPLPAFAAELRLARTAVRLENPHVIDPKKQLFACVVGTGPSGIELKSTYANRSSDNYKDELGRTLDRLARACPKGGILVFFASYGAMDDCVKHWQHSRQGAAWRSLLSAVKGGHVIVEPKTSGDMSQTQLLFDEAIHQHGSAMLLAVCRGKVAEGMDFSDDRCRLVVVTGIPFAPAMDPRVVLKKKFLNDQRRDEAAQKKGSSTTVDGISGDDWYAQQAGRAVNQALGRVIRHRNDFGAILLCDARFGSARQRDQLSKWVRSEVAAPSDFNAVEKKLRQFFNVSAHAPTAAAGSRRTPAAARPAQRPRQPPAAPSFGDLSSLLSSSRQTAYKPPTASRATFEDAMLVGAAASLPAPPLPPRVPPQPVPQPFQIGLRPSNPFASDKGARQKRQLSFVLGEAKRDGGKDDGWPTAAPLKPKAPDGWPTAAAARARPAAQPQQHARLGTNAPRHADSTAARAARPASDPARVGQRPAAAPTGPRGAATSALRPPPATNSARSAQMVAAARTAPRPASAGRPASAAATCASEDLATKHEAQAKNSQLGSKRARMMLQYQT